MSLLLQKTINEARQSGLTRIYHGLIPLLLRDVTFSAIYWTLFEWLHNVGEKHGLSPVPQNFLAGAIAGMTTSTVVTPLDLIKTRQQVLNTQESVWASLRGIAHEEGYRGLLRGLTPRVTQTILSMSVMMVVYDNLNRYFLKRQCHIDVYRDFSCVY